MPGSQSHGDRPSLQNSERGFDSFATREPADIVQRQDHSLPNCRCGFDSRCPLSSRPHHLVAQDIGLSNRERGFNSRWGRHASAGDECCKDYTSP